MFNPIFKGNFQWQKHPGRCAFAETELLSQKSKHVVQKNKNGHRNPNNSHKYRDEIELYQGINKRNTSDTPHQNNAYSKHSLIDCDGVQLTNAQCHMVPMSVLWYRESSIIQLKYIFETKQEWLTVSYHATHRHDKLIFHAHVVTSVNKLRP